MEVTVTTFPDKRPRSRFLAAAALSAMAITVAGCAAGPDFKRPAAPRVGRYLPEATTEPTVAPGSADASGAGAQRLVDDMDIPGQWWTLFQSPPLDELIARALEANPDLEAAQAALRGAREIFLAGQGALAPSVDASFQPTRQRTQAGSEGAAIFNLHTAQANVGFSPDIFGGVRRGIESLQAQADLQRFQLEAAYLSLTANVVNAAIQEAALRGQIEATRESVEIGSKLLEMLRRQHRLGHSAAADIALQEAALAQAQATLPPLEKQLAQQRNLLAALAGRFPGEGLAARFDLSSLQLPQTLPLSLPSKLVEQRPDIRAAEETLHAASAQVGVAAANRLPNITLSAALGGSASAIGQLLGAGSGFWLLAGSLAQPVFRGGALLHQERAAQAAYEQAAALYRGTVLSAFREVADTLHAILADTDAFNAAQAAEHATAKSLAIAKRQLALGDIGTLTVLLARQSYLQAKVNRVQAQASRLTDTVALFQALGGGWWNRSTAAGSRR